MPVYVVEIKGTSVAAFGAGNNSDTEEVVRDCSFRDDLMVLAGDGLPLWDGVTKIEVRQARPDEEDGGHRAPRPSAMAISKAKSAWIAFLVAPTDPDRRKR